MRKFWRGQPTRPLSPVFESAWCPKNVRGVSSSSIQWLLYLNCVHNVHGTPPSPSPLQQFTRSTQKTTRQYSSSFSCAAPIRTTCPSPRTYTPGMHFYQNRVLDPYLEREMQKVSLRQLVVFGRNMTEGKLLRSANYVRTELPVRLAHRIRDFQSLPFIVGTNPHIVGVYDLYWSAFETVRSISEVRTLTENRTFCEILLHLLNEHIGAIPQMALGISESVAGGVIPKDQADAFMNGVLRSRVSRRVIAEQHIELTEQYTGWHGIANSKLYHKSKIESDLGKDVLYQKWATTVGMGLLRPPSYADGLSENEHRSILSSDSENVRSNGQSHRFRNLLSTTDHGTVVGVVNTHVQAGPTAQKCAQLATQSVQRSYGVLPPQVEMDGNTTAVFTYIPSHIEFILYEVLKNAMQATLEHRLRSAKCPMKGLPGPTQMPPIRLTVCQGDKDIIFRVSDRGGGIPRSKFDNLWSFSHVAAFVSVHGSSPSKAHGPACGERVLVDTTRPLPPAQIMDQTKISSADAAHASGLGLGLSMSRVYANYWGGSLQLFSVWGYGTDAYVTISRIGNQSENLDF